jgi:7,8-dihydroneopterin aldolase/epimerase/oxygenase
MDKLVISGIKINMLIGVHEWEKKCPQNIYFDIALKTNTKQIALEDSINQAIDYDKILQFLLDFTSKNHVQLIETLAERVAEKILQHFPTQWVQLTIHKPGAIMIAKDVSITIERTSNDLAHPLA